MRGYNAEGVKWVVRQTVQVSVRTFKSLYSTVKLVLRHERLGCKSDSMHSFYVCHSAMHMAHAKGLVPEPVVYPALPA